MQYMVDEPIEGFDIYKALEDSYTEGKDETFALVIRNMLERKYTDEQISECSGLSIEEINKIKKDIYNEK